MTDPTNDTEPTPHHFGGPDEPIEDEYAAHQRREAEKTARHEDTCGRVITVVDGLVDTACGRPSGHNGGCRPVPLAGDREDAP